MLLKNLTIKCKQIKNYGSLNYDSSIKADLNLNKTNSTDILG